jgi:hypothetical protein
MKKQFFVEIIKNDGKINIFFTNNTELQWEINKVQNKLFQKSV